MSVEFDVQYFADEAEKEDTGVNEPSDAGEVRTKDADSRSFDELIRGEYREEYGKRVEEIVRKRLGDHAELKRNVEELTGALKEVGASLGVSSGEPNEIIFAIRDHLAKSSDSTDAHRAVSDSEGERSDKKEMIKGQLVKLIRDCKMTREYYPQFDIRRELADPRFRSLLKLTDNDPKKSFEILHHDEIMTAALKDAARLTEEKLAGSIASKAKRPSEGAKTAVTSIYINHDPRSLSKEDREDIKRRVRRGERITW